MLGIRRGMVGKDSLNKHVEQISFRQCVTFCEHRKMKGWQLHFQPTEAKSLVCGSHTGAQSVYGISKQILHATTPWPNPLLLCMRLVFFCSCKEGMGMIRPYCRAGGAFRSQEAQASGMSREWMLLIPRKNGGKGFLKQTCTTSPFGSASHFANMGS